MPFIETEATRFYYEEAGEGTPLVFLHGLGASIQDWEYQLPVFSRHFRCITIDLRGYGRSERGTGPLSVPRFAADVWAVLQELGIARYCLIGHSMGGAVALQMALDHPRALRKLVIANSVPTFRPENIRQHFEIWYRLIVMSLLGPVRLADIGAQRMFPDPDQVELRKKNAARGARNSAKTYIQSLRALTHWSVLDRLGELKQPVLIAAAEHDYFTRDEMLLFAHSLPKGRFHMFPGAHHGLPMEAADAFNKVVLKFLGRI